MIGFIEGLAVTIKTAFRKPVTDQYPDPDKRHKVAERYMGFPALLWDYDVPEPYCTGCMVCVRACPTQCMSAQMTDNPKFAGEESRRRKIIEEFEINLGRCILCGICVDVCNFDAIEMSHEHELSKYERNGNRADLGRLLDMGREYQGETGWRPTNPAKNSGVPVAKPASPKAAAAKRAVGGEEGKASPKAAAAKKASGGGEGAGEASPKAAAAKKAGGAGEASPKAATAKKASGGAGEASPKVSAKKAGGGGEGADNDKSGERGSDAPADEGAGARV